MRPCLESREGEMSVYSGNFPLSPRQAAARTRTTPATDNPVSKGVSPPQAIPPGKKLPWIKLVDLIFKPAL